MMKELLNTLSRDNYEFYSYISGYLFKDKEELDNDLNCIKFYFNDNPIYNNHFRFLELRKIIFDVNKITEEIKPDIILTFSDNRIIFQELFKKWKCKSKIVLFHEGYGDYSDPSITTSNFFACLFWKILIWPNYFKIITRSYTGFYNYSLMLMPELINRKFTFTKHKISTSFLKRVYDKDTSFKIVKNSIFVCFSGREWKKINHKLYFIKVLRNLNNLNRTVYIKIPPNHSQSDYEKLIKTFNNVIIIDDKKVNSETYCLNQNIDIIVTDESSSVINSIFCGIRKKIYFLNEEINELGLYKTDRNDLINYLVNNKIVIQSKVDELETFISKPENATHYFMEDENIPITQIFEDIML